MEQEDVCTYYDFRKGRGVNKGVRVLALPYGYENAIQRFVIENDRSSRKNQNQKKGLNVRTEETHA